MKKFYFLDKKIYDPVHGFIRFDVDEKLLIDSFAFQRLRNIHQLGGTFLVFPGATHCRFDHSLGVMELATHIYDKICYNVRPDLFNFIPRKHSKEFIYWKKILRLAALSHDLGHLPFSHVAEGSIFQENESHEKWTFKIIKSEYLSSVWGEIEKSFIFYVKELGRDIVEDIIKIALGEEVLKKIDPSKDYKFTNWERILSDVISGEFFGSDRIDYLLRDAKFTGVAYGLFDYLQLIEMLRILPKDEKNLSDFELGIDEDGVESCEALIFARHFMYKRVYQNPNVLSYNFHIKQFMEALYKDKNYLESVDAYLMENDAMVTSKMYLAYKDKDALGHIYAKKIIDRKNRFKAILLPKKIDIKSLIKIKEKNNIEDDKIEWMFSKDKKIELSFPVARNLSILKAKKCSFLLSQPLNFSNNWVFVSPEYEIVLFQALS